MSGIVLDLFIVVVSIASFVVLIGFVRACDLL